MLRRVVREAVRFVGTIQPEQHPRKHYIIVFSIVFTYSIFLIEFIQEDAMACTRKGGVKK